MHSPFMKKIVGFFTLALTVALISCSAAGQVRSKHNYPAQKKFIPAELGQVYLGMPLKAFAAKIELKMAEADDRFEPLELKIPFGKGNITEITFRIHGLTAEEKAALLRTETVRDDGFDREVKRLKMDALPAKGIVYAMYIGFKKDFDLKSYVAKIYGPGEVRKKDNPYHFSDTEWTKKTPDGLTWLIRAFYEDSDNKSLQLLGRIKGTEWDPGS
jgi:hypothetical protein